MNSALRQKVIELRTNEELSYTEIMKRLNVPRSTLSYWLREFPLSDEKILELRRKGWKKGEASRERFRATMRKKKEEKDRGVYEKYQKQFKSISRKEFFAGGIMLYLAEGSKKNHTQIALANTDPQVIRFYIRWILEFFDINRKDIKVQLHLYENMDISNERQFWEDEIKIQERQFYKPSIRKLKRSSFSYKGSHRHGTCSIYVLGVEKNREVMMAIKAFLDRYEIQLGV